MKYQINTKRLLYILGATALLTVFQNCGSDVKFATQESITNTIVCDPLVQDGNLTTCDQLENGLIGEIYYFLNKSLSNEIPSVVYDVFDNGIMFPDGIQSVEQFFTSAHKVDATLILSKIETPTIKFDTGFIDSKNQLLMDKTNKPLFEGFAIRVNSLLKLPSHLSEGRYEFALLSDDGSTLEIDTNGDNVLEKIVDNDGLHSTRFGCSASTVNLKHSQFYPLRLKYYQGPRTHIALTLMMRKVSDGPIAPDELCGHTSSNDFYGSDPAQNPNYVPDLINSKFGDLTRRGWFVPQNEMFVVPR